MAGIEPKSLHNSLKRNRFFEEDLLQLRSLLSISEPQLAGFEYGLIPESARRKTTKAPSEPSPQASEPNEHENRHFMELCGRTRKALELLGSKAIVDDLFRTFVPEAGRCGLLLYLLGDEEVIEWVQPTAKTLTAILNSLELGLRIVYLFPHHSGIQDEWPPSGSPTLPPLSRRSQARIRYEFERFKEKLVSHLRADHPIRSSQLLEKVVHEQIDVQFFRDLEHHILPGFKFALLGYHLDDSTRYGRFANINLTVHEQTRMGGEFGVILPLAERDVERLVRFSKHILANANPADVSPVFKAIVESLLW